MKAIYVYPGSFCPPTYGHVRLVERATALFGKIFVVCSTNPDKENYWFSAEERVAMWKSYELPKNVEIETLESFSAKNFDRKRLVIVRGLRDEKDFDDEKKVIALNKEQFGIDNYFHILAEENFKKISSKRARTHAQNLSLDLLAGFVSPLIQSRLLEKALEIKNLFMVVGRPGSGKSTFLKMLREESSDNYCIFTDAFSKRLKPLLEKRFSGQDFISLAKNQPELLKKTIAKPWMEMLSDELGKSRGHQNVFVEVPYGLQPNKAIYRFLGGKIIYLGCQNASQNSSRLIKRGTPEHIGFIDLIPGRIESCGIALKNRLELICFDTSGTINAMRVLAKLFNLKLQKKGGLSCSSADLSA